MEVQPLNERHDCAAFECGVESLDRYLRLHAIQDGRRHLASSFVIVNDGATPLAYYTLARTTIELATLSGSLCKALPCYPSVSAALLSRLAVDQRHRGRRFGEHMLMDAFARALRSEIATYAVLTDAKSEQAAAFYRVYDFRPLPVAGHRLFLPMTEIARLFTWSL